MNPGRLRALVDDREWRLRKVEMQLRAAEKAAELQAHRRIAVLAVAVTFAGTTALAGIAGQVPVIPAAALVSVASTVVVIQFLGLVFLERELQGSTTEALVKADRLMTEEGEHDVDPDAPDP